MPDQSSVSDTDLNLLRRAIRLAADARAHGNHPFGALLADSDGNILAEAKNTVITERDVTGHAETNLVRIASRQFSADIDNDIFGYVTLEASVNARSATGGTAREAVANEINLARQALKENSP